LVGFVLVLAWVASPLRVVAQEGEAGATPPSVGTEPVQPAQRAQPWLERMHPEAFEAPTKKPGSDFEIEYAPAQSRPHTEEGRRSSSCAVTLGVMGTVQGPFPDVL
jgi:hypothetical protein